MGTEIKSIIEIFEHPLSGVKGLLVEADTGIETVYGDWRMIDHIIEDVIENKKC